MTLLSFTGFLPRSEKPIARNTSEAQELLRSAPSRGWWVAENWRRPGGWEGVEVLCATLENLVESICRPKRATNGIGSLNEVALPNMGYTFV